MMQLLMFMVLLFAIVVSAPVAARHPHPCSSALNVKNMLDMKYDETVRYGGISGTLISKVYVAQDGSWTLVYISPDGAESCIMASGEKWHDVPWEPGQKS